MSLRNPWECPQLRMNTKIRQGVQSRTNRTTNAKKMIASAELVFFAFPQVLLFNRYNSLQVFQNAQVLIALHAEMPREVLVERAVGIIVSPDLQTTSPTRILTSRPLNRHEVIATSSYGGYVSCCVFFDGSEATAIHHFLRHMSPVSPALSRSAMSATATLRWLPNGSSS
jgi:hypothetical protein